MIASQLCEDDAQVSSIRQFVRQQSVKAYNDVLSATNYRLPLKRLTPCNPEEKAQILNRVRKEWTENEAKWRSCLADQERMTRCKSVRLPNGVYQYHDIDTGLEVHLDEYRRRYMSYTMENRNRNGKLAPGKCDEEDEAHVVMEPGHRQSIIHIEPASSEELKGSSLCSGVSKSLIDDVLDDSTVLPCTSMVTVTMVSEGICFVKSTLLPFPLHAAVEVSAPSSNEAKRQRVL